MMALFQIAAVQSNLNIPGSGARPNRTLQRCSRLIGLDDPRAEVLQNETVL